MRARTAHTGHDRDEWVYRASIERMAEYILIPFGQENAREYPFSRVF